MTFLDFQDIGYLSDIVSINFRQKYGGMPSNSSSTASRNQTCLSAFFLDFCAFSSAQLSSAHKCSMEFRSRDYACQSRIFKRTWKVILLLFWQCTENTFFQTFTQICHLLYLILSYLRWLFIKKLNYMYNNNNNITTIVYVEQKNILSYWTLN
jgi:hypothetical protein